MTRILAFTALALGGCAFENGPAREVPVELLSPAAEPVTTDLGWEVTLTEGRVFLHYVTFLAGSGSAEESGSTQALLEAEPAATFKHAGHGSGAEAPAEGTKVGELLADAAVDLLAAPVDLGTAVFACGAEATEAHLLVAPPEEGGPEMHGAGLYLAGSAVPPGGGVPVAFEAALPVDAEIAITGLDLDADDLTGLEIHVPREGWLDGIDFAALPGGAILDGSVEAEAIEERLSDGGFHVHTGEE